MDPAKSDSTFSTLTPRPWLSALLFGIGYFGCATLGNAISLKPGPFVTVWLPSGLFVAMLLLHERRHWLMFILAAFLANLSFDLHHGQVFHVSALFFAGNCLEALVGAWLVQRFVADRPTLKTLPEVLGFIVCSALASPILSASIGAGVISHFFQPGSYWKIWPMWFTGDVLGITILAPCLLTWRKRLRWPDRFRWTLRSSEEMLYLVLIGLGSSFVFKDAWHHEVTLDYMLIPMVVCGAWLFGIRVATLASLGVAVIGAWMTAHGQSHISRSVLSPREQAITLQLLLAVTAFCGMVFAALISERKLADEGKLESENQFRDYIEYAPIGIFISDETGRSLHANPAMSRLTGYTFQELLEKTVPDLMAEAWRGIAIQSLRQAVAKGYACLEVGLKRKDGVIGFVAVEAVRLSPSRLLGFASDLTEQKRIDRANHALLQISEATQSAPSLLDLFRRLHGIVAELVPAKNLYLAVYDEEADQLSFPYFVDEMDPPPPPRKLGMGLTDLVIRSGKPLLLGPEDLETMRAEGKIRVRGVRPLDWLGVPLLNTTGTFGVLAIMTYESEVRYTQRDTELLQFVSTHISASIQRKKAEEEKHKLQAQLLQSQKMESLGILAGGVAHDMNNVLGAILGLASANLDFQPAGSPGHSAFNIIIQAAERGGKMVKSLLGFARQTLPKETAVDLNATFQEAIQILERTTLTKVRLDLDLAPDLRPIRGDAHILSHAFMNLCVNAVDAIGENGTLTLRTRNLDKDWVEAVVEDTGTGMPEEVLEKALDPFFTTKEVGKGTGLGLSMVYSTVKAHHGQIEIQSEPGRGTCIRMRFPASEPAPQAPGPMTVPPMVSPQRALKVLLVDDDDLIQRSTQMLLGTLGHTVTIASSGEEALTLLAGGLQPNIVILDLNMPGLGGTGTLPRLRALQPSVPVLLATGRVDEVAMALVAAHPHTRLLAKPYGMEELRQHLKDAL